MRLVYTIIFFVGMFVMSWLAYSLFQAIDNGFPAWRQGILVTALGISITGMVLFIRHYLRQQSGPNDK
jgi:hypothetical protein